MKINVEHFTHGIFNFEIWNTGPDLDLVGPWAIRFGDLYDFAFQVVKVPKVNHIIVHVKTNKQMWLPQPN